MQVLVADAFGMCFGVRDALAIIEQIENPRDVTIHGELVHNETVLFQLDARGFRQTDESDRVRLPESPEVLITAHGVSDRERRRLEAAGKRLIDTTCPLVTRVHQAAQKLEQEGFHLLVIGRPGHVEVQGIVEDLQSCDVIQKAEEVRTYPHDRLGIVCQTTTPARDVARIQEAIRERNPHAEVRFVDTVCHPTKDRQKALETLLDQVDAVVVIGGRNSNNTRQLVNRCGERGVPAFHVQSADDLQAEWFLGCQTVGLTAGTSTLDTTVQAVHAALLEIPATAPQPYAASRA